MPNLFANTGTGPTSRGRPAGGWNSPFALAAAFCGLAWFGWTARRTRRALFRAPQQALQVAGLRGTIAYLDEVLTMSARMAVHSGDPVWKARYDTSEPLLGAAIAEAIGLATPEMAERLARTTDEANRRLTELEHASFALDAAGHNRRARRLLEEPRYRTLKSVYASGIEAFGKDLETLAARHTTTLGRRAWLETSGLVMGGAVFLLAAALARRGTTQLAAMLARTEAMARQDVLTGLSNRLMFSEHMEQAMLRLRRGGQGASVLCIDLDGFKGVNDMLGHAIGDELLRAVAARLRRCTRETDLVARLGGDEFAVVRVHTRPGTDAAALAERLTKVLQEPFDLRDHRVAIGASIGIATADQASVSADRVLRDADVALYQAKTEGRGTWRIFHPEMDARIRTRRALEADLRRGFAEEQFEVYYQPLVDAGTEQLSGFEALVRWNHPERGLVFPDEFIAAAEETGLIVGLGAWVLERACADAARWPGRINVAVNLSPVQFLKGDLVREVEQALATSGLAAGRLELEITESVLLQNNEATLDTLRRLHALGARISMDDFGTGYSSLSYLSRFPFDKVKIDKSFVRTLGAENRNGEIVCAVIGLCRALGIRVLAEGVETIGQLRMLQAENCNELQGYLFSRPIPLGAAQDYIGRSLQAAAAMQRPGTEAAPAPP